MRLSLFCFSMEEEILERNASSDSADEFGVGAM